MLVSAEAVQRASCMVCVCPSLPFSARASPTPTPYELRPIYEAESPDELALVDAAYAYNVKLLKRTPGTAVVSLPGTTTQIRKNIFALHSQK